MLRLKICIFLFLLCPLSVAYAQDSKEGVRTPYNKSGLPVPRFVSLSSDEVNIRTGPGTEYPIQWILKQKGLPVEVVLEYDNWRKVKDSNGDVGWVYHTLLSGKRTAIITGSDQVPAYKKPSVGNNENMSLSMYLESGVLVGITECQRVFCNVQAEGFSGWVQRKSIWGVYEHENIH